jgi:hypothetical protein
MAARGPRSTRQVFEDHLRKRRRGRFEEDLAANYAEGVVLLTPWGAFRGHDGVRRCAARLFGHLPCPRYTYRVKLVAGEVAFLEWSARCPEAEVDDGADSFLIRGGLIVAQTIHYTVRPLTPPAPGPGGCRGRAGTAAPAAEARAAGPARRRCRGRSGGR